MLRDSDSELRTKKAYIEEMEPQVTAGNRQVNELTELLKKKEEDMKNMEERFVLGDVIQIEMFHPHSLM